MSRGAPPSEPGLEGPDLRLELEKMRAGLLTVSSSPSSGVLRVEVPTDADPLRLWDLAGDDEFACFWETAGESFAGLGISTADPASTGGAKAGPRRFGALPFAPGGGPEWAPLIDVGIVQPRWTLRRTPSGRSELLLVLDSRSDGDRAAALEELTRIERALAAEDVPRPSRHAATPVSSVTRASQPSPGSPLPTGREVEARGRWTALVRSALDQIAAGRFRKTVLARRVAVELPDGLDGTAILRDLREEAAGQFRFGVRHGGAAFVGASPECLFRKRGRHVEVEALAGTYDLDRSDPPDLVRAAEHLFASGKDLEEHALVVRGIVDALAPLAESVAADEWPRVREARRLAHLSTTVRATLQPDVDVPGIIDALHPTPAVGGLPREPAVEFLLRAEPEGRGLFAAPVGWVDPAGDACFAVGIRSALIRGATALVFAGAGIVAGSDPDEEWRETEAKSRWLDELIGSGP